MTIEKRISDLEAANKTGLVCPDCIAQGLRFTAWCDHRLPPPFDRFVPINLERKLAHVDHQRAG